MTENLDNFRAALARGTRASALRLTRATCEEGHALVDIVRGDDQALVAIVHRRSGGIIIEPYPPGPLIDFYMAGCRCNDRRNVPSSEIQWAIENYRRRFVPINPALTRRARDELR